MPSYIPCSCVSIYPVNECMWECCVLHMLSSWEQIINMHLLLYVLSFLGSFLFLLLVSKPYIELGFIQHNSSLQKLVFFKSQKLPWVVSYANFLKSRLCQLFEQVVHDDFIKMNFILSPYISIFTEALHKYNAFSPRTVYMSGCVWLFACVLELLQQKEGLVWSVKLHYLLTTIQKTLCTGYK